MDFRFSSGNRYAIVGPNGSGKSTFLKVVSGFLTPSEGEIEMRIDQSGPQIPIQDCALRFSVAAPYIELIEEFTLKEHLDFHFRNKPYLPGFDASKIQNILGLQNSLHKSIRFFSSGMKQRVKIVLACCSESDVLLLDEPTSNLDQEAVEWFHHLLEMTHHNRIVLIGSNQPEEYKSCREYLRIPDFRG